MERKRVRLSERILVALFAGRRLSEPQERFQLISRK